MAEDDDGVSNKKTSQNSNNEGLSEENGQIAPKPDLGIEEAKYNSNEDDDRISPEAKSSTSKSGGAMRKEENPFSFRHFLKRDLSLPGNSSYENTGARPKVYANTVQHSPTKIDVKPTNFSSRVYSDVHADSRREMSRTVESQAKEKSREGSSQQNSDNTSSSSSVEIPFSVVDSTDSKHNLYTDSSEGPFYHRPNLASEPLGMPSLPDFVQDHILVEQAYLNSNGPITVDLDNLPDFTISSSSLRRRNNSNRNYDYDAYSGAASTSNDSGPSSSRNVPLDIPGDLEAAAAPLPLDLPPHLNLDLTESVNPADRRNNSPRSTFPLDLPPNAGAESMRLPDFLPIHPGRTSPEPEHQDEQFQQIITELERTRSELFAERSRRSRLEGELASARDAAELMRSEVTSLRGREAAWRARARDCMHGDASYSAQLDAAAQRAEETLMDTAGRATDAESTVAKLKNQIKKLKEELAASRSEVRSLRSVQSSASRDLRQASSLAETSLRELLQGLDQLKTLSSALDQT